MRDGISEASSEWIVSGRWLVSRNARCAGCGGPVHIGAAEVFCVKCGLQSVQWLDENHWLRGLDEVSPRGWLIWRKAGIRFQIRVPAAANNVDEVASWLEEIQRLLGEHSVEFRYEPPVDG